jgi:transcription elongation factor Elf1
MSNPICPHCHRAMTRINGIGEPDRFICPYKDCPGKFDKDKQCPECGSTSIVKDYSNDTISAMCSICGHEWRIE